MRITTTECQGRLCCRKRSVIEIAARFSVSLPSVRDDDTRAVHALGDFTEDRMPENLGLAPAKDKETGFFAGTRRTRCRRRQRRIDA